MNFCGYCGLVMERMENGVWSHLAGSTAEVLVALECPRYAKGAPDAPYQVLTEEQRGRILENVRMPGDVAFDEAFWNRAIKPAHER